MRKEGGGATAATCASHSIPHVYAVASRKPNGGGSPQSFLPQYYARDRAPASCLLHVIVMLPQFAPYQIGAVDNTEVGLQWRYHWPINLSGTGAKSRVLEQPVRESEWTCTHPYRATQQVSRIARNSALSCTPPRCQPRSLPWRQLSHLQLTNGP